MERLVLGLLKAESTTAIGKTLTGSAANKKEGCLLSSHLPITNGSYWQCSWEAQNSPGVSLHIKGYREMS
jgi:hypothetical protein